jgi:site-specific recombinase XerD
MIVASYLFHLRARNFSAHTIKAAKDYLTPFVACHDPLTATKRDIEQYLISLSARCKPSTVWTAWRHLKGLFGYLYVEGDIDVNPMSGVCKPIVPPIEVKVLDGKQVQQLLATCKGKQFAARRDYAILTMMMDTGLRLSEITSLSISDISENQTIRIFGKGRKWRTVALGQMSSTALSRWLRVHHSQDSSSRYPLRFTNKSTLELARKLKPGDHIEVIKGRFDYRYKRAETELRVAEFVIRSSSGT